MTTPATMNTGDVSRRIGIPVTVELLQELGFKPVGQDKRASLWEPSEYPAMCDAVGEWVKSRRDVPMQPKPARTTKKAETPPASTSGTSTTAAFDGDDDF